MRPMKTAVGHSKPGVAQGVPAAVEAALKSLEGRANFGLLLLGPGHPMPTALSTARSMAPGARWLATHTAGEFSAAGLTHEGVVAMLFDTEGALVETALARGLTTDPGHAAAKAGAPFAGLLAQARTLGLGHSVTLALVDALGGAGDRFVSKLRTTTRMVQHIAGGAAGDEGQFKACFVGNELGSATDAAAVAHFSTRQKWGLGVGHGLKPATNWMQATKVVGGNLLAEIDGKPAFSVYKDYAKQQGIELTPANAANFMIANELGLSHLRELKWARAPVGVGPNGELKLVADIVEGTPVCILDGDANTMVAACRQAAMQARDTLDGPAAGVIVFDCICRGMILKDQFAREIDAVSSVFPDTPIAGFLTYGEIARFGANLDGWNNTASVVVAIPSQ